MCVLCVFCTSFFFSASFYLCERKKKETELSKMSVLCELMFLWKDQSILESDEDSSVWRLKLTRSTLTEMSNSMNDANPIDAIECMQKEKNLSLLHIVRTLMMLPQILTQNLWL